MTVLLCSAEQFPRGVDFDIFLVARASGFHFPIFCLSVPKTRDISESAEAPFLSALREKER